MAVDSDSCAQRLTENRDPDFTGLAAAERIAVTSFLANPRYTPGSAPRNLNCVLLAARSGDDQSAVMLSYLWKRQPD